MPRLRIPPWLRRGLEAAVVAATVAVVSLVGDFLTTQGPSYPLPTGPAGALALAPAVLALGSVTVSYPVALAATRSDALFGAVAAFLVAADVTLIIVGRRVILGGLDAQPPAGLLVALLAILPALIGLIASQLATPLGFGKRAGAWAAGVSAVAAVVVLALLPAFA